MKWRPIKTAPKDGTKIIVRFVSRDGDVEAHDAWFDGSWMRISYGRNRYEYFSFGDITHWIPIPEIKSK